MALRDQPYLPLYVQDYLTDEKLNMCSWSTQGIYIKILCILHKQELYGRILFKQKDKQNISKENYFATILIKNIPCQYDDMITALNELIEHKVLVIENEYLLQKRMVKDFNTSEERSKAAKKGGGNPILFKQKDKQITEYEDEYEDEVVIDLEKESVIEKTEIIYEDFENFRKIYPGTKKGYNTEFENFKKKHKDWKQVMPLLYNLLMNQINAKEYQMRIGVFVPPWKHLTTYINQRCWEEIINTNIHGTDKKNNGASSEQLTELLVRKLGVGN